MNKLRKLICGLFGHEFPLSFVNEDIKDSSSVCSRCGVTVTIKHNSYYIMGHSDENSDYISVRDKKKLPDDGSPVFVGSDTALRLERHTDEDGQHTKMKNCWIEITGKTLQIVIAQDGKIVLRGKQTFKPMCEHIRDNPFLRFLPGELATIPDGPYDMYLLTDQDEKLCRTQIVMDREHT